MRLTTLYTESSSLLLHTHSTKHVPKDIHTHTVPTFPNQTHIHTSLYTIPPSLPPCSGAEACGVGWEVQRAQEDGNTGQVPQQEEEEKCTEGQTPAAFQEKTLTIIPLHVYYHPLHVFVLLS